MQSVSDLDIVVLISGNVVIENAELFNNDATGEIVPFSGQEVNLHNVAKWTENGEEINLHLAIFAE